MKISPVQVRIFITHVWLMSAWRHRTVAHMTSCVDENPVSCHIGSGDEKNCDNVHLPNDKDRTHICSKINVGEEKEKCVPPKTNVFRGKYSFLVDPVPRRDCFDEEAMEFIQEGFPVVLENCTFHKPAMKWTTTYLLENLQDKDHTAYFSNNRKFLYYDEDRIKGVFKEFKPPTRKMLLYFKNFSDFMDDLEKADNGSRAYFQSILYLQNGVSESMLKDIDSFNYTWLLEVVRRVDWGEDVSNLLLVGMPDVVTPAHFDVLQNLYVQIYGRKRVILFSPDYFRSLYPYPVGHPHDRQTQVDFENPDLNKFPRFGEIRGMEVALEPDQVLYIPSYWWHYIESESLSRTISINFWFDPANATQANADESVHTSNVTRVDPDKEQNQYETDGRTRERSKSSVTSEDGQELNNEDLKHDVGKKIAEEENKKAKFEEKEETPAADGTEEKKEDDEQEKTLTAAQYLALLRDTEMALFKATFSHERVKQILDELLSRRFEYLTND